MSRIGPGAQFLLFLAAFFAVWTLRATWLIRFDQSIPSSEARMAFAALVKAVLWVAPAVWFAYRVRMASPIRYLGMAEFPKPKTWAICLLAIGAFCALILFFEMAAGHKRLSLVSRFPVGFPSNALFFVLSPFVEEIVFRGLVLKELSGFMRIGWANIAASLLFAGIHLPYWIGNGTPLRDIASASVGIVIFSLFAGWLYSFGKSIWPPTAAHIANNILSSLLHGE